VEVKRKIAVVAPLYYRAGEPEILTKSLEILFSGLLQPMSLACCQLSIE